MSHWRTLLSKGIPKAKAEELNDGSPGYWSMFTPFNGDPSLLRLSAQSNESIDQLARALGLSEKLRSNIYQLDAQFLLSSAEKATFLRGLHPAIDRLWTSWEDPHSELPRSNLTTLGVTLAHAHLSSLGKAPGPLSIWLA